MKTVKEKIDVRDQEEWYDELFIDRGNQNGNKLRTYRQFKQIDVPKHTSPDWFIDRIDVLWLCSAPGHYRLP
jgi:hypothetical protein